MQLENLSVIEVVLHLLRYSHINQHMILTLIDPSKQKPQLCSSLEIDVNKTMHIVPPGCVGNRRALLIGINYVGQKGELRACHNDVNNVADFLMDIHGFKERDMLILMDDGKHKMPTKKNIMTGFRILTSRSMPGDVVFVMYSGKQSHVIPGHGVDY